MNFFQFFGVYKELIQTGGIQCTAESDNVMIKVHGNVAGDILVFISPNAKTAYPGIDMAELIRADHTLYAKGKSVIRSMKYKFIALAVIPRLVAWLFNVVILYLLYFRLPFNRILTVIDGKNILAEVLYRLPLLLPLLTLVYGKPIGLSLLKPILFAAFKLNRMLQKICSRKVAYLQ